MVKTLVNALECGGFKTGSGFMDAGFTALSRHQKAAWADLKSKNEASIALFAQSITCLVRAVDSAVAG